MVATKDIAGLVVAAGGAKRMGGDKPFVAYGNSFLLDAVISRVRSQCDILALNVCPERIEFCRTYYRDTYPLLTDPEANSGPLGGVIAGLGWISTLPQYGWLATFPCDTPFLPHDMVARLIEAVPNPVTPVVVMNAGQSQNLCAIWPRGALQPLQEGLAAGTFRSVWYALKSLAAAQCPMDDDATAFLNVNTPAELANAELLSMERARTQQ